MTIPPTSPFQELASRAELPASHVLDALRQQLAQDTTPRSVMSRSIRTLLSACTLLLGVGLSAASQLQASPQTVFLAGAIFCIGAAGLLMAGAVPTGRTWMRLPTRRALVGILAATSFIALAWQADHFLSFSEMDAEHRHRVMKCCGHAFLSGLVASGVLMFLWRRSDPFSPSVTGAFLGLMGGLVGTLGVELICASNEGLHLTFGHGLGTLVLSVVGAYAGSKWLSP